MIIIIIVASIVVTKGIISFKYSSKYIEYLEKNNVPIIIIKDVAIYQILLFFIFVKYFIFDDIKYTNSR